MFAMLAPAQDKLPTARNRLTSRRVSTPYVLPLKYHLLDRIISVDASVSRNCFACLQAALSTNCDAVIAHSQRRKAFRGAVIIKTIPGNQQHAGAIQHPIDMLSQPVNETSGIHQQSVSLENSPMPIDAKASRPNMSKRAKQPNISKQHKRKRR